LKTLRQPFLNLLLLICPLLAAGCNSYVANRFVQAPNRDWAIRGLDAPQSMLLEYHVSQQLRLDVGPPTASLSVWIVDPIPSTDYLVLSFPPHGVPIVRLATPPQDPPSNQPAKPPRGTVFLLPGLGDGKEEAPYQFYSLALARQGYRVILVDHRGHGRSTGDRISYGACESRDMVQVLDALQQRGLIAGEVGAVGISYGASIAICWAAIDPRLRVVVALEPFSSLHDAESDAGPMMLGAYRWMYSIDDFRDITRRMGRLAGFDPDRQNALVAIAHTSTPILLIHGESDDFVRPTHSIHLHQADPDHSQLILVPGADHFDLWFKGVNLIMRRSDEWFGLYLTPPASAAYPATRPERIN
jgi:pimeloyl-ACP methyl ester carboxylesterase